MKFMLVTDTFPPLINGVSRTLRLLAAGLADRGHEVAVITTVEADGSLPAVSIEKAPSLPLPGYPGLRLGLASRRLLERRMRSFQPDGVYVAVESMLGMSALSAARRLGIRAVSGFHTNFHSYSKDYRLPILKGAAERYLRWFHNRASRTLTPSVTTASELRTMGIPNVGVMGRGVDASLFHPAKRSRELRAKLGAGDETPVALYAGRIAAEKNMPLAIKAFHRIQQQRPDARCVFAGGGPRVEELRSKHPEFHFAGACDDDLLAQYYASADIFIFPSLTETYGNVVAEAMASGLVTAAFDYAAGRLLIRHGETGYLAAFGDEAEFLTQTDAALANWRNDTMRTAARKAVEPLSWSDIVVQFERELLGGDSHPTVPQPLPVPAHA